jgi:small subunit ribosomal protein S6
MPLYESVFIIRQDMSSSDVDKITDDFVNIIKNEKGSIVKTEYWGLRNLAYEIDNNKKGHYVFLGFEGNGDVVNELQRKMKLSENIIRYMTQNVKSISSDASPILKGKSDDNNAIDVTLTKI